MNYLLVVVIMSPRCFSEGLTCVETFNIEPLLKGKNILKLNLIKAIIVVRKFPASASSTKRIETLRCLAAAWLVSPRFILNPALVFLVPQEPVQSDIALGP
jgi:hypothetical protein